MKNLWNNFISSNYIFTDNPALNRKAYILNIFMFLLILIGIPFSFLNFFVSHLYIYGLYQFFTAITLIFLILYIRKKRDLNLASNIVTFLLFSNLLFYTYSEQGQNNSFVFISTIISFSFILQGLKKGMIIVSAFLIFIILLSTNFLLDENINFNLFSYVNVLVAFFVFIGIIYSYQYLLEKSEKNLQELNNNLEYRINKAIEENNKQHMLLIQKSKLEDLGETFAMLTHQWQQPLSIIVIDTNILLENLKTSKLSDKEREEILKNIINKTKFMFDTLNSFNSFLKPFQNESSFLLYESINQMSSFLQAVFKVKNIDIIFEESCDRVCSIIGKENEFKQVILNILTNAANSIEERQKENIDFKGIILIDIKKDKELIISIKDNGVGLKEIENIFEPYITTKESGSGIGLYISHLVMEKMGGKIELRNQDFGCEVILNIPISLSNS